MNHTGRPQRLRTCGCTFVCGKQLHAFESVHVHGNYVGILGNADSDLVGLGWAQVFALLLAYAPCFESQRTLGMSTPLGGRQPRHMPMSAADLKWYFVKFTHFFTLPVCQMGTGDMQEMQEVY